MNINNKKILITGAAGFIGFSIIKRLLNYNCTIIGIDNLNDYYDVKLKQKRLNLLDELSKNINNNNWHFFKYSIENENKILYLFERYRPHIVIHLAAQAGVRYSLENPNAYFQSNLLGFCNILESLRQYKAENFIFASSSSVYGVNKQIPFSENQRVDWPVSLYAATKKSNELLAHSYSHLYGIPTTGLRFFTVYGPWGRPDMAPMIFAKAILRNEKIDIFNFGDMVRDFTYIDDVTETIFRCCYKPAKINSAYKAYDPQPCFSFAPYLLFNVGNENPIKLKDFINLLENNLGKKAIKNFKEIQQGDVTITSSNSSKIKEWINFSPQTSVENGVKIFSVWFKKFYQF